MSDIATAGIGAAANLFGMALQNQQGSANMQQSYANQVALNQQMQDIQQQNWDYTNYENQRKHIENAGLNVGMLYGMGGAGGSTMGGASGGSAQMAHPAQAPNFMEVGQQIQQGKLVDAEVALKKAQEDKLKAETPTTGNLGDATLENILTENEGKKLDNMFKTQSMDTALETARQDLENKKAEWFKLVQEGKISQIEANNRQKMLTIEMILKGTEAQLNKAHIKLANEQRRAIGETLAQGWEKLSIESDKNKIDMNNAITNHFRLELDKILGPAQIEASERNATKQAISHLAGSILMTGAMTGQFSGSRNKVGY